MSIPLAKNSLIASWILAVLTAGILTVLGWLPKLTGDVYAQALFERVSASSLVPLGADAMRWLVGSLELVIVVLVLIPITRVYAGILAIVLMGGAIMSHLVTPLGLFPEFVIGETTESPNYILLPAGVVVLLLAASLAFLHRGQLPIGIKPASVVSP